MIYPIISSPGSGLQHLANLTNMLSNPFTVIPYKNASIQKFLTQVAKKFNQPSLEDLIATIGYGGIATSQVMPKVRDFYNKEINRQEKEKRMQEKEDKIKQNFD